MPNQTEKNRLGDVLKWEEEGRTSREEVTVLADEVLEMAAVIGKEELAIPAAGVVAGTGNGTCDTISGGAETMEGDYVATCIDATVSGSEIFEVKDPKGRVLGNATVGVAFANEGINFTINDGTTDFVVSDTVTITVGAGSGKVEEIDFSADDGAQNAYGFMTAACDATGADKKGVAITKDAVIAEDNLVWPAGTTAGQKAAALAQLKAKGIISRTEA